MSDDRLTPEAQNVMEYFDAFGKVLRDALPRHTMPEPELAKTPTKVSHLRLDREQYVSAPGLLGVWIRQTGAVVKLSFLVWPDAWRGSYTICAAAGWTLHSHHEPHLSLSPVVYGLGVRSDCDGRVAQRAFDAAEEAAEAYEGILALLNAAKDLAERTLTLEKA